MGDENQNNAKITDEQVQHVAKLARLSLDDQAVARMRDELTQILGYVDKLGELDVDDVEPMAHAHDLTNALRVDEPTGGLSPAEALRNAPDADEPFFKVPKVLGQGPGA